MRTIIIGDIHGCSGALRLLLAKIMPDEKADRLILLGDLFDRGPDSWGVFQMVRELADKFGDRFVLLRGNHDDYLLTPKLSISMRLVWERVGRGTTVKSFKAHGEKMEDTAAWIGEHVVPFYRGEGFQCVHAGLKVDPIEMNDYYTMIHDHGARRGDGEPVRGAPYDRGAHRAGESGVVSRAGAARKADPGRDLAGTASERRHMYRYRLRKRRQADGHGDRRR